MPAKRREPSRRQCMAFIRHLLSLEQTIIEKLEELRRLNLVLREVWIATLAVEEADRTGLTRKRPKDFPQLKDMIAASTDIIERTTESLPRCLSWAETLKGILSLGPDDERLPWAAATLRGTLEDREKYLDASEALLQGTREGLRAARDWYVKPGTNRRSGSRTSPRRIKR